MCAVGLSGQSELPRKLNLKTPSGHLDLPTVSDSYFQSQWVGNRLLQAPPPSQLPIIITARHQGRQRKKHTPGEIQARTTAVRRQLALHKEVETEFVIRCAASRLQYWLHLTPARNTKITKRKCAQQLQRSAPVPIEKKLGGGWEATRSKRGRKNNDSQLGGMGIETIYFITIVVFNISIFHELTWGESRQTDKTDYTRDTAVGDG